MYKLDHGAPLKADAGQEDYDLRISATLIGDVARWNLPAGMSNTHLLAIGSPEWQLRESDSLTRPLVNQCIPTYVGRVTWSHT